MTIKARYSQQYNSSTTILRLTNRNLDVLEVDSISGNSCLELTVNLANYSWLKKSCTYIEGLTTATFINQYNSHILNNLYSHVSKWIHYN